MAGDRRRWQTIAPGHRLPSFAIVGASMLMGCSGPSRLLPLAVGQKWDYRFRWGVERDTGRIEVVREVPVAGATGWELRGPMGVSRLGYAGDRLVADQLGGAFLTPSLPIGIPPKTKVRWHGRIVCLDGSHPASALIAADEKKLEVQAHERLLNRTVVTMRVGDHTIELTTWYAPGEGIVQQEQRTDDKTDMVMERIASGG